MKFKCGYNREEKVKSLEQAELNCRLLKCWRKWFAWYPVKIDEGDCRWLETVLYRHPIAIPQRSMFDRGYFADPITTEYKALK